LEVYEIERDWRRAIEVAKSLLPRKLQRQGQTPPTAGRPGQRAATLLAQYYCELADEERNAGDPDAARKLLQAALASDKHCVRASILLGKVEYDAGRFRQAIRALRRVRVQDAAYLPETIELLRKCYAALDETQQLQEYLAECLATKPTPALVAAVAADMVRAEDREAAGAFLAAQLLEYPSLPGLAQLIGLQRHSSEGEPREDLAILQDLTRRLIAARPTYRCGQCGFAGKHLHWNCPGCKHWGTIKAMDEPGAAY
jgi:lipopolysaccharide biosynthesis regulator YciM